MKAYLILSLTLLFTVTSYSSDHIDGPITSKHKAADLADFYMFPTPQKPASITLIMNSHPIVSSSGHFEDRLRYIFKLRPLEITTGRLKLLSEERTILCTFKHPHSKKKSKATCMTDHGLSISGPLNKINENANLKLWAGMRSDPFFFNAQWATDVTTKSKFPPPKDDNILDRINTLSIVIELDIPTLFPQKPQHQTFAAITEIDVKNDNDTEYQLLDRIGRPEITNVSLVARDKDKDIRDDYNTKETFDLKKEDRDKYIQRLIKNISYYDALDNIRDWSNKDKPAMAEILVDDYLIVDLSKTCSAQSFLSIERALFKKKPHTDCGGRFLTQDIMDELFTLYITKDRASVRDGVDKPYRAPTKNFPYLAPPDLSLAAKAKAFLADKILR